MSYEFGRRLQEFRSMRGFTATYMTQKVGVPRSTYTGWENGVSIRNIEFYPKLAKALNISISELLTGEPDLSIRQRDD
jgi:transcriptional regulator with XRE-family HTH domain